MSNIDDIIAELERATGPNRVLDGIIFKTLFEKPGDDWHQFGDGTWCRRCEDDAVAFDTPKDYTVSIDDALTLVPQGCPWLVNVARKDLCWARCFPDSNDPNIEEWGVEAIDITSGPAIALCIAALKARCAASSAERAK